MMLSTRGRFVRVGTGCRYSQSAILEVEAREQHNYLWLVFRQYKFSWVLHAHKDYSPMKISAFTVHTYTPSSGPSFEPLYYYYYSYAWMVVQSPRDCSLL